MHHPGAILFLCKDRRLCDCEMEFIFTTIGWCMSIVNSAKTRPDNMLS